MHSHEARAKASKTYKEHGNKPYAATIASHTKEAIEKNMQSRKESARHIIVDGKRYLLMDAGSYIGCSFRTVYRLWRDLEDLGTFVYRGHVLCKDVRISSHE